MQLPVHDYLDALGIPYTTGSFPPTTAKGAAEVAKTFGYAPRQMVKTLIFEVDTGEKVLVMVGGDQNAISGHLKKAIGSRNIKLASPQTVRRPPGMPLVRFRHSIGSRRSFGPLWMQRCCTRPSWGLALGLGARKFL